MPHQPQCLDHRIGRADGLERAFLDLGQLL
jgi:hypothetical protein